MPGIINKVMRHKKVVAALFLLLIITAVLVILGMYLPAAIIIAVVALNEFTVRKMNKQKAPFGTYSKIRNADCLIIGDISPISAKSLSESDKTVSIYLPGCTLAAVYEVLRHTFSILKENGGITILAVKKKNINKTGYSPLDICFYHPVTINRLGLKNVKFMRRFPVIFAPIKSLMFLCGIGSIKGSEGFFDEKIVRFCSDRGIEVKFLMD